ncbi:hypothetical protein [Streptomyces sp. 135]|uniref:hypothetical protein n=1 Tax=Streptomyces sp. 135 TaxID=2838850 RepID=UPI001CBF1266|nr:hypothetical protein [Streptomyces sp. 135]
MQRLGVERARAVSGRGVQVRSLYAASALGHPGTREYVAEILESGGEVRVGSHLPPRMALIGRRHLFIDNHVLPDSESDAGWHVFDVAAVAWSRRVFAEYWDFGTPWQQAFQAANGAITNERQRKILRQLDAGYHQQQVGAQVGLSERAVSKELAELRSVLRLRSTYQLMSWWGRSPERDLP